VNPSVRAVDATGFEADAFDRWNKKRGDVSHSGRAFSGNAVVSEHVPKFAESVIDVRIGAKFPGDGSEFCAYAISFEDAALFAGVEETERGMRFVAKHDATAIVGRFVRTSVCVGGLRNGRTSDFDPGLSGHGVLLFGRTLRTRAMLQSASREISLVVVQSFWLQALVTSSG